MHGQFEHAIYPRLTVLVLHGATIMFLIWALSGAGGFFQGFAGGLFDRADVSRRVFIGAIAIVYFARTLIGMTVFSRRRFDWVEAAIVSTIFISTHVAFAALALSNPAPLNWMVGLLVATLYLAGSLLNSLSENQRYRWKQVAGNKGHIHKTGLFRHGAIMPDCSHRPYRPDIVQPCAG